MVDSIFQRPQSFISHLWLQLTLPYRNAMPTHIGKPFLFFLISLDIALYLGFPKLCPAFGQNKVFASFMSVPEATVYKDDRTILAHHDIWMPRQSRMVHPIPETMSKEIPPNQHLWLGVLAVYGCHTTAALLFGHLVHRSITNGYS